jgi:spore germination protein YaaH
LSLGVPPAKISLGLPTYSQAWHATYDTLGGARTTGLSVRYADVGALLAAHNAQPVWDAKQKETYAIWDNEGLNEYLWLVDARSFTARLPLVSRYRLRGYSVWVLGFEDPKIWEASGNVAR